MAVSGERISQGPPRNVGTLGCPPPPRRVSERSVQTLPVGSPFQNVVLTAQIHINPETSLETSSTSSRNLTAWKLLPNISPWLYKKGINTVWVSPDQVYWGVFHRGGPPAGSGNGTRSESSVRERGHRICTTLQQGNRGLQPVFHSSKEGWGLRPILDLERLRHAAQMLTLRQIMPQIRSEDWFVTIDLKDAYFHISILLCHRKFLRFTFGQSIPISGSSVRPSVITLHFHEM